MKLGEKIINLFSGGILEKGLGLIDKVVKDKDLAENLKAQFQTLVQTQTHEVTMKSLEIEQDFEREQTKRIQAEQGSNDAYTQRTRPKIARLSFYFGSLYILANIVTTVSATLNDVMLDWSILTAIYSPALAYMGVRTFDKWKQQGVA